MKTYEHFRLWANSTLPAVFDESLSYYELLCKVVAVLNEHSDGLNELSGEVDSNYTELNQELSALKEYVDNYFEGLDVESYINSYIQALIDNGTFPVDSIAPETVNYTAGQVNMPKSNFKTIGRLGIPSGHTAQASQVVGTTIYILHHEDNTSPMWLSAFSLSDITTPISSVNLNVAIHGNSMVYDSGSNQFIITDTGSSDDVSIYYVNSVTLQLNGSYAYKGSADGNTSGFAIFGDYAIATLTSTYHAILYKVDRNNGFMKSLGIIRLCPSLGNSLKQDVCANDRFFAMLSCNMTHDNTESPQFIDRQKYEQNTITIFDKSRGFIKNVYFDKFLGIELEGLSVVDNYVDGVRNYRFYITDLKGNLYQLDTTNNSTGFGNIALSGGLFGGIDTPLVTYGGDDGSVGLTYSDSNGSLSIPNNFKSLYNNGNTESTYISNMLRTQTSVVAFNGFTGLLRQTSNTIRVSIYTPKTQLALSYNVLPTGIAQLSGYTYSDNDGENTHFFDKRVNVSTTYEQLITQFLTDVAPLLTAQYGDLTITYGAVGYGFFRFPRYYRTALTYLPLTVQ